MENCEVCTEPKPKVVGTSVTWGNLGLKRYPDQILASAKGGCRNCRSLRAALLRTSPEWERDRDEDRHFSCYIVMDGNSGASKGAEITIRTKEKILRTIMFFSPAEASWSVVQRGLIISGDTSSPQCLDRIKTWIKDCQNGHQMCRNDGPAPLPKRVLDVLHRGAEVVKLYETKGERIRYACLSHCWGKKQLITTTKANLSKHTESIPLSALPPTFRDAVQLARRLSLQYLWIDSLCILQDADDLTDWAEQAALMVSIYANSFLTIAATASVDSSGGLFRKAPRHFVGERILETDDEIYTRLPLRHGTHDTSFDPLGRAAHYLSFDSQEYTGYPLLSRAWAFQERIHSPRIVHFAYEVVWECNTETRCECTINSQKQTPKQRFLRALQVTSTPVSEALDDFLPEYITAWRQMVSAYSAHGITYETDRLPACSSFAGLIRPLIGGRYLAGLWENILLDDLCWYRMQGPTLKSKSDTYVSPSWSWPSIGSKVFWAISLLQSKSRRLKETHLDIIHVETTLTSTDPFGAITAGYLIARGPFLAARYELMPSAVLLSERYCLYVEENLLEFYVDYTLEAYGQGRIVHGEAVYLLSIGRTRFNTLNVMVLRKRSEETYERIGLAEVKLREINREYPDGRATIWKGMFENAKTKEFKII